jgi:chromosome segregation ATPase
VKDYLSECIRKLQSESSASITSLKAKVDNLSTELERSRAQLGEANIELNRWKTLSDDKCAKINAKMTEEIANEKERSMKALNDLQDRFDQERRQTTESHARSVRQMENRIAALDYENKDLTERKHRNEAAIQVQDFHGGNDSFI